MVSQYQLGHTQLAASGKPTFFHNANDVELFYPPIPGHGVVRRTKPGGENVRRTATINDKRFQQIAINRESVASRAISMWIMNDVICESNMYMER
jgi:hypothetical protein